MAINPEVLFPGKIAPSDAEYPYGKARDVTTSGDGTGTPWKAALVNDLFGLMQALLFRASIVPSGDPDTVLASDYLDAMDKIYGRNVLTVDALRSISGNFDGQSIQPTGYEVPGDGGGGPLRIWRTGGSYTDNGGSVVTPGGIPGPDAWVFVDGVTVLRPEWYGAKYDGTDETDILLACVSDLSAGYELRVRPSSSGLKFITGFTLPDYTTLSGENWVQSILWYAGVGNAVTLGKKSTVKEVHVTSADPTSPGWFDGSVAGSGKRAILLTHTESSVLHCTFSHFNSNTLKSIAIEATGSVGFSNSIRDNTIRYCWGGISLKDTVTDTDVIRNDIAAMGKFGISVGWNWDSNVPTGFVGDNFRIQHNTIQEVIRGRNPIEDTGDGYGLFLARGANFSIFGNYFEEVWAGAGRISYAVYANGMADGLLLNLSIRNNNSSTTFAGEKYSVYTDYAWYGEDNNNHWTELPKNTANTRYWTVGPNFYTGAPADPFANIDYTANQYRTVNAVSGKRIASTSEFYSRSNGTVMAIERTGTDGELLQWQKDGAPVGSISVAGGVVTYGTFNGSHWAGTDNTDVILPGTIMSSVNELSEAGGDHLPMVEVSTRLNDKAVYGVYMADYGEGDNALTERTVVVSSLGAGFIRIKGGVQVSIGDFITSSGDGTGVIQQDDALRSSTVGKVTSTETLNEYQDGSFLIPCTLHCG